MLLAFADETTLERQEVVGLYRDLLRAANQCLPKEIRKKCRDNIQEAFRIRQHEISPHLICRHTRQALAALRVLRCLRTSELHKVFFK